MEKHIFIEKSKEIHKDKYDYSLISKKFKSINFTQQKKFKECKDKKVLPFDFYLNDLNICIEFDGKHHFCKYEYWGGNSKLEYTQKHDQIKNIYCKENKIKLIRIKYNENINNKLDENIKI